MVIDRTTVGTIFLLDNKISHGLCQTRMSIDHYQYQKSLDVNIREQCRKFSPLQSTAISNKLSSSKYVYTGWRRKEF